ncbi:18011_t:CDS:2 [Acaulospora morrowiae]|uniref:18011_t:CDS:1 n=1 Tax=Acaulospora morrowiae TaxID=94023 RepID=A0A9N8VPC4_9GLOM|nr:18011_t:CDS:2 [Acaulospora morrowiae]
MRPFENRLLDIGGIFLESFVKIKGITVKELLEKISIESIKSERNLKRIEYQEEAFKKAITEYMEHNNESWILKTFGANADTTKACFNDILKTHLGINEQPIQDLNSELLPNEWTKCSYKATVNIWEDLQKRTYNHMQYLVVDSNNQEANNQNAKGQHEETSSFTTPLDTMTFLDNTVENELCIPILFKVLSSVVTAKIHTVESLEWLHKPAPWFREGLANLEID